MIVKRLVWAILALAALLYWFAGRPSAVPAEETIDWGREPIQTPAERKPFTIETSKGEVTLVPRADYDVAAVVESVERYRFDEVSFLSPIDAVLAWGDLPTPKYRNVDYSQSWRFFFWRTTDPAVDLGYVGSHAANTHLLPADENVRRAVLTLSRHDAVRLTGELVDVRGPDGLAWRTSLVRTDSGDGSCEVLWVESVQIGDRLYR